MEVSENSTMTFAQLDETKAMDEWKKSERDVAVTPVRQEVQLPAGGKAVLYALVADAKPHLNEITSVGNGIVLNSAGVWLGEYGTIRELAESEPYHWADMRGFTAAQYTLPIRINARRYLVWLRLDNQRVGMEQSVIYTDLGNGVARVDRLWRTVQNPQDSTHTGLFSHMASYLASDKTM